MTFLAIKAAIGLIRIAKAMAWLADLIADCGIWIIDQCDPAMRRRP